MYKLNKTCTKLKASAFLDLSPDVILFQVAPLFLKRAFPCPICLFNTAHLVNSFSSLAFLVKNSLSSLQLRRGEAVWRSAASRVRGITALSDGLPRCWMSWPELRASGTHCYGNITVSVFRLCCAVR